MQLRYNHNLGGLVFEVNITVTKLEWKISPLSQSGSCLVQNWRGRGLFSGGYGTLLLGWGGGDIHD